MNQLFLPQAAVNAVSLDAGSNELSALIASIYDAALDHSLWLDALERIADFAGGVAAGLLSKDSVSRIGDVHHNYGVSDEYIGLYRETYWRFDPLASLAVCPVGEVMGRMDLVGDDEFLEGRFYKEWALPQGFFDCANIVLDRSSASFALLSVIRGEEQGLVDDRMRHRLGLLVPHVQRAVHIGRVIDLSVAESNDLSSVVDSIAAAVFFFDADGRLTHTNAVANEMLAKGDVAARLGGRLVANDRTAQAALRSAIESACAGDLGLGDRDLAVSIETPQGERYVGHLLPLKGRRGTIGGRAAAALFVRRAALDAPAAPALIARTFELTPSEVRVLIATVETGGVRETALALGIGEATVRTHLHRIFGKTGTERQADLVKLVAAFASPISR